MSLSGHKFGLSYVGVGWVIWRDKAHLPKDLIFELHYLGSIEYSFSLNFSRPAAPIIAQYFNFVHLGFEGYRRVALDDMKNARLLARALEKSRYYTVLSDVHRPAQTSGTGMLEGAKKAVGATVDEENIDSYVPCLPVVAFRFTDEFQAKYPEIKQKWIQTLLRAKGWWVCACVLEPVFTSSPRIVPNYELAPNLENIDILRVVVRENMSAEVRECQSSDIHLSPHTADRPSRHRHHRGHRGPDKDGLSRACSDGAGVQECRAQDAYKV